MSALSIKSATYGDLVAAPAHLIVEIIDGRLVTRRHLPPLHSITQSSLILELGQALNDSRGGAAAWTFLHKPELHLGAHVVVPDMAAWSRERLPSLPDTPWMPLMPDWICDVDTPSMSPEDRDRKRCIYAEHGLTQYWLLDPAEKHLDVFELGRTTCVLRQACRSDTIVPAPPFSAAPFPFSTLWPFDKPPEKATDP